MRTGFLQRALAAPQLLPLIRTLRAPRSHALPRKTHGGSAGSDRVMCLARASQPVVRKPTSRPSLDDVDRLSRGEAAKRRGTGSRAVPHRLNEEEMRAFTVSKSTPRWPHRIDSLTEAGEWVYGEQKKLYMTLKGSGYRRNRRLGNNNPVVNTFRQWADAQAWPAVILEQGTGSERPDIVVVDTSPMRLQDGAEVQRAILGVAAAFNCEPLPEDTELKPDAAAVSAGWRRAGGPSEGEQGDDMGDTETDVQTRMRMESGDETVLEPSEEEMAAADARVAEQGRAVRELKEQGAAKDDPALVSQVAELLEAKAARLRLDERAAAVAARATRAAEAAEEDERNRLEGPVWMLRPNIVQFACEDGREQAQALATALVAELCVKPVKKATKTKKKTRE